MTVWEKYTEEQRTAYEDYLKMFGSLSALFNQKSSETGAPYIDSKFQETIYAKSFDSLDVDIGNTPHDIQSTFDDEKIGIGIKTWLNSKPSYQKVMQLKSFKNDIDPFVAEDTKDDLAYKISSIKNERLIADYKRLGLKPNSNIYHYVTRDKGVLQISETSYPLVDIDHLKPGKLTKSSFTFYDGLKKYKYTFGDSQIWMYFGENESDTYKLDTLEINIFSDPFSFLRNAFLNFEEHNHLLVPKSAVLRDYLYLPLYSYQNHDVLPKSGLNAWNADPKTKGGKTLRPEGEAYIPIPKALWKKHPYWVDPNVDMSNRKKYQEYTGKGSYSITLHMPDGSTFPAIFSQDNFKSLQTNPQNILGKWILNVLGIKHPQRLNPNTPSQNVVTMDMLKKAGYDSVKLWHQIPNNYHDVWIDFAEFGSFERYMNDELQAPGEEIQPE